MKNRVLYPQESVTGVPLNAYAAGTASFSSEPIYIGDIYGFSVQFSCPATGSPNGSFTLQYSDDIERNQDGTPGSLVANWVNIPNVTAITASGSAVLDIREAVCYARWLRVVYTASSGSITATVKVNMKTY